MLWVTDSSTKVQGMTVVLVVLAGCIHRPHMCERTRAAAAAVVVDDGNFSKSPSVKVVLLPACIPQREG